MNERRPKLAPLWHTLLLIAALLTASVKGNRADHSMAQSAGPLPQYLWNVIWEWILLGFTWLGIRKRISLRELIGERWRSGEEFLRDIGIAAGFWMLSLVVLGTCAKLMHLDQASKIESMRRQLGFLTPRSGAEVAAWLFVCLNAGFCEEIIFRGYLQRQFAILTRSMLPGILLSALVFGASHGYEGVSRMILIALFGFMFGILAWWRKSLRPGMIAHAWHDAISGLILRALK
jgi:uncharacterized protein